MEEAPNSFCGGRRRGGDRGGGDGGEGRVEEERWSVYKSQYRKLENIKQAPRGFGDKPV